MGIFFTIFRHLTELWVPFSGDFSEFPELWPRFSFDLRNYDPKIHQNLRNYGYQFYEQNGTSPSDDRSRYPPPPELGQKTLGLFLGILDKNLRTNNLVSSFQLLPWTIILSRLHAKTKRYVHRLKNIVTDDCNV